MENIKDAIVFFEAINNDYAESDVDIEFGSWAEADLATGSTSDD